MATTITELKEILDEKKVKYFASETGTLSLPIRFQKTLMHVMVRLEERGEAISWLIPCFMSLPKKKHRQAVLLQLLQRNRVMKFAKFTVDPTDGEVQFVMSWPIEDGTLTGQQVQRALSAMFGLANRERAALKKLVKTGKFDAPDGAFFRRPSPAAMAEAREGERVASKNQGVIDAAVAGLFARSRVEEPAPGGDVGAEEGANGTDADDARGPFDDEGLDMGPDELLEGLMDDDAAAAGEAATAGDAGAAAAGGANAAAERCDAAAGPEQADRADGAAEDGATEGRAGDGGETGAARPDAGSQAA